MRHIGLSLLLRRLIQLEGELRSIYLLSGEPILLGRPTFFLRLKPTQGLSPPFDLLLLEGRILPKFLLELPFNIGEEKDAAAK